MAIRTYIPGILAVANYLKKYVNKNATILEERLGTAGYALVVFVVDLLIIVAELINGSHTAGDQWSDFTTINTLDSTTLQKIAAAVSKFYTTIGVTP